MAGNLTGNSFTQDKNKGVFLSNQVPKGTKADTFLARRVKKSDQNDLATAQPHSLFRKQRQRSPSPGELN